MTRITFYLPSIESEALKALSQQELRDYRAEALLLVRESLQQRGLLPAEQLPDPIGSVGPAADVQSLAEQFVKEIEVPAGKVFLVAPEGWMPATWANMVNNLNFLASKADTKFIALPHGTRVIRVEPEQPE